jgi:tRNA modification GTPase
MIGDTIVALATPSGPGARAVLRLSGPQAFAAAVRCFASNSPHDSPELPGELAHARAQVEGHVHVVGRRVPAMALTMIAPRSFTGEDVVELHVPGSPVLVRLLQDELLRDGEAHGIREALPGEFTARACENGRLNLAQAEGLLMLLHAQDQQQALGAVQWLQGGLTKAVQGARIELQDALALLEVGLDFDDGDTGAVPEELWLTPLQPLAERMDALLQSLPTAAPGGEVLLVGRANAGKSSLVNALSGQQTLLVADHAGTTRDLLRVEVAPSVYLWDAPGDLASPTAADDAALALRERLSGRAAGLLVVLDASDPHVPQMALSSPLPWFGIVFTKCDLVESAPALTEAALARLPAADRIFVTSSTAGTGLSRLKDCLRRSAGSSTVDAGGPLRTALQTAADAVRRAIDAAALAPELAAAELQAGLRAMDGIAGEHSPEQLLDRIYGRFCLGK